MESRTRQREGWVVPEIEMLFPRTIPPSQNEKA